MADHHRMGSLGQEPDLDRWVTLVGAGPADGRVVVRTGKVELGQGILTALAAIAADELGVDPARIDVVSGSTGTTPNEWITAGSGSVEQSGMAVRQACAHARRALVERAAVELGLDGVDDLVVEDGTMSSAAGRQVDYWALSVGRPFDLRIEGPIDGIPAADRKWSGRGLARLDLAAKVRGEAVFVHDLVLPGMRHARVVRTARPGARLEGTVPAQVGRADVVRNGSFLAVVADREADAEAAATELAALAQWEGGDDLPDDAGTADFLVAQPAQATPVVEGIAVDGPPGAAPDHDGGTVRLRATYTRPFLLHGSIGPSAAVAQLDGGHLTVWSHTQGPELIRLGLAEVLRMSPSDVTVHHMQGPGCYGHNGADDVALDAALVAAADPGRPVSLKWTRSDEHRWEPVAPAMSVTLEASLDDDGDGGDAGGGARVKSWQHDVHSYPHVGRPFPGSDGSGLLAAWDLDSPFPKPAPRQLRSFHGGGYRNADPQYRVGDKRIVEHFVGPSPLRTSSTRGLGAYANVFAIESFMDELALAAGSDPVTFRLAHLDDQRAHDVIEAAVDLAGGLVAPGGIDAPGRGLAYSRYENIKAYCAVVAEVTVDARTGLVSVTHGWIAADAGEIIDPDGLTNQLEGGFVQATSWTLKEQVDLSSRGQDSDDATGRPGDWDGYPILRFSETPDVTTRLIDRPDRRVLGAGEASTGPTAAAIANAVFQATGARLRDLPLRPPAVRRALDALL